MGDRAILEAYGLTNPGVTFKVCTVYCVVGVVGVVGV
jgi:hypothetical protein